MSRFVDTGDGTITDNQTGLMWEQGEGPSLPWPEALNRCRNLNLGGHSDWRLPTISQLAAIIDYDRHDPACDPVFGGASGLYWSATTYRYYPRNAWVVGFNDGLVDAFSRENRHRVRAVRGGAQEGAA